MDEEQEIPDEDNSDHGNDGADEMIPDSDLSDEDELPPDFNSDHSFSDSDSENDEEAVVVEPPANDEYFNQLLEAVPRIIRNRIRGRRQVVVRDEQNDDEEDENVVEDSSSENEDENLTNENGERFDPQLPTQHSYLGEGQEVAGRTILDEDLIQEIPIISRPGIILMPDQTLPLNLFEPRTITLMKNLISGSKTFGVVHQRYRSSQPGLVEDAPIGTTAEIYEFREPTPEGLEVGLKIKAKGRQRFKILSQRRQVDGIKMATVEFLKEIELTDPFYDVRLLSRDRLKPFPMDEECSSSTSGGSENSSYTTTTSSLRRKSMFANFISRLRHNRRQADKTQEQSNKQEYLPPAFTHKMTRFNHYRTPVGNVPLTPFPKWVYEQYDGNCLVEKVHHLLGKLRLFSQAQVIVPREPKELSYWLASNLPLDDKHKLKILGFSCAIRRLRYQISLMEQCPVLCCRNCGELIAKQEDIFSMSSEGPQGAYVNPGGYVHETLTLYKTKNLNLVGESSTQYSWFPGYAWTICQCSYCDSHMGWKFKATKDTMVPKKFWGISRRSIRPELKLEDQEGDDELRLVY